MRSSTRTNSGVAMRAESAASCADHLAALRYPAVSHHAPRVSEPPLVPVWVKVQPEHAPSHHLTLAVLVQGQDGHGLGAAGPNDELTHSPVRPRTVSQHPRESLVTMHVPREYQLGSVLLREGKGAPASAPGCRELGLHGVVVQGHVAR